MVMKSVRNATGRDVQPVQSGDDLSSVKAHLQKLLSDAQARAAVALRDIRDSQETGETIDLEAPRSTIDVDVLATGVSLSTQIARAIEQALRRLELGTYGVCEECAASIPVRRLLAVPFASRCLDCQMKVEPGSSGRRQW